jgi:hypothetical protein
MTTAMGLWLAPAAVAALLSLLPQADWSRRQDEADQTTRREANRQVVERLNAAVMEVRKSNLPVVSDTLAEKLAEIEQFRPAETTEPRSVSAQAIAKLDDLLKEVDKVDVAGQMAGIQTEQPGPARALLAAMQRGDFAGAKDMLRKLEDMMRSSGKQGEKDPDLERHLRQLEELARRLQEQAARNALDQAMEQRGVSNEKKQRILQTLSREDLDNERKLREAMAKEGLTEEQIKQILDAMRRQRQRDPTGKLGTCMSGACEKMGALSASGEGDLQDALDQLDGAGDALWELEQIQQQLNQLKAQVRQQRDRLTDDLNDMSREQLAQLLAQCGGAGEGSGQGEGEGQGDGMGDGQGSGALGQGNAPSTAVTPTDTASRPARQHGEAVGDKAIARSFVLGDQVKGVARQQLIDIVASEARQMADPAVAEPLPKHLQEIVKDYLDDIQRAAQRPERDGETE